MSPKSLSRILLVKERLRQWKRAELASANASVDRAQAHFAAQEELRKQAAHAMTSAGELSGDELVLRADAMKRAHRDSQIAHATLLDRHRERDAQNEEVATATRDVRILETLRDRALSEQNRNERRSEQSELDDMTGRSRRKA